MLSKVEAAGEGILCKRVTKRPLHSILKPFQQKIRVLLLSRIISSHPQILSLGQIQKLLLLDEVGSGHIISAWSRNEEVRKFQ